MNIAHRIDDFDHRAVERTLGFVELMSLAETWAVSLALTEMWTRVPQASGETYAACDVGPARMVFLRRVSPTGGCVHRLMLDYYGILDATDDCARELREECPALWNGASQVVEATRDARVFDEPPVLLMRDEDAPIALRGKRAKLTLVKPA